MELEKGSTIILDNNEEYFVANLKKEGDICYLFLMASERPLKFTFARLENDEITTISDDDELETALIALTKKD